MCHTNGRAVSLLLPCWLLLGMLGNSGAAATQSSSDAQAADEERQLGASVYDELKQKRELIESSPLYAALTPISDDIIRAAQPRYGLPMKVILVHDPQPNAYAAPGGNIYVNDELLYFVHNKEELAGTLCHEVSHLIHHDSLELMEKQVRILQRELGAAVLLGPSGRTVLAAALLGRLHSLSYSRDVEERADLTGADLCAASGHNPWGLVWLFQDFGNAQEGAEIPQFLSDHPDNENRMQALEAHFKANPGLFSRYSASRQAATTLAVAPKATEVFLR